ncbi:unnamed protein product [marine sediment metagenome]|uniref:Uncharacterized protein n=1 Tax=marine sediment metagenome TaxID=412755 RepID=X1SN31_9ZZZZ
MTNQQIDKIWDCLAVILEQVKMLFYYGALLEQRKSRLEEIEGRVLRIRDILKDEKKGLEILYKTLLFIIVSLNKHKKISVSAQYLTTIRISSDNLVKCMVSSSIL